MSRGDRRQGIVRTDDGRELFVRTLGEACAKTDGRSTPGVYGATTFIR